jgi:NCAIR mutase (PurE)-related protein
MNKKELEALLTGVKSDQLSIADALEQLKELPYRDLDYAKVDYHRDLRNGFPEVIYRPGKSLEQIRGIVEDMLIRTTGNILISRAEKDVYEVIKELSSDTVYFKEARAVVVKRRPYEQSDSYIAIVSAGTADIPVAEEAVVTAEIMGNRVKRIYDVGVAGIHRLFDSLDDINKARVIIVVAGMEGALASVVGGLTDRPIIAVPTSIGYGANFAGVSALLGMLTSCASGVAVVNIDNGFGAACMASRINQL